MLMWRRNRFLCRLGGLRFLARLVVITMLAATTAWADAGRLADVATSPVAGPHCPSPADEGGMSTHAERHPRLSTGASRGCFVSLDDARLGAQSTLIVDIRSRRSFARYRIPGSIQIPLHAVGRKPFLKDRSPLIVGPVGIALTHPNLCDRLREWGLPDAKVLDRGIAAWIAQGGALEGEQPTKRALLGLKPGDLFAARSARDWLVVAPDALAPELQSDFPDARVESLSSTDDQPAWSGSRFDTSSKQAVLLVTADGGMSESDHATVEPMLRRFANRDTFVLQGGIAAYRRFLDIRRALLAHPAGSAIRDTKRCAG